ncbi:MAG: hypothetical protein PHE45_08220, partial [Bacteroidales bacterium]|nr:hypothetical protein [Bacteroidales bacterium]
RMGIVFLILCVIAIIISYIDNKGKNDPKAITINKSIFHTSTSFNVWSIIITAIVAALYIIFW